MRGLLDFGAERCCGAKRDGEKRLLYKIALRRADFAGQK
jgi:hypothetical protein